MKPKPNWDPMVDALIRTHGAQKIAELAGVKDKTVFVWRLRGGLPSRAARRIRAAAKVRGIPISAEALIG